MGNKKIEIDRVELEELYLEKNLSPYKLGDLYNCSFSTITNRLKEYGIPLKDNSTARVKSARKNFSGDTTEKAYMLGFRIGDLNVYKTSPTSKVVITRCHTTSRDQLSVIKDLFCSYGKVTISKSGTNNYHINCFLNNSFDFLLSKYGEYKRLESKEEIFAFIAGYSDAEGYFGINQGRARFKIDSYDVEVLQWIYRNLFNSGIRGKIHMIGVCQDKRNFGNELWRLNVNHANDLLSFIKSIMKFARHKKRIEQMLAAESNILLRKQNGSI